MNQKKVIEVKPASTESIRYANEVLKQLPEFFKEKESKSRDEGKSR